MKLTDDEKAMLDGEHGLTVQKAMELQVRYGTALGAERQAASSHSPPTSLLDAIAVATPVPME